MNVFLAFHTICSKSPSQNGDWLRAFEVPVLFL